MAAILTKLISLFTAILLALGVYTAPQTTDSIITEGEQPLLRVALLADSQIWANSDRHWTFKAACEDIENNAGALDAVLDVAVAGAVQSKVAGHPQQIAQQGPAQRRAVHLAQPADKEGGRRRVMEGVARRLTGVGTQRIVIKQDVRALQADDLQGLVPKAVVCVDSGHKRYLRSYGWPAARPWATARRNAKNPRRIRGAITITPTEVLPDSWVIRLTRKVPTKEAPLPQMSSRP